MIGKTLAHYEILEKLGAGGMGEVYRARDTKLNREVAVKILPAEFASDADRRKRFQREAQAIAALKHPNIVTIYSVEEDDDVHFITMEFVEGDTLSARIPKGGLPIERFFEYSVPLADAISGAHEAGITHRDLKPANVMFDKGGRLKVLDFGLAKLLSDTVDPEQARTLADRGSDTAVGQILGTAAYMSPEQAEGKVIDHRSDVFSLGIVLFEMATGERPFKGDTHISVISSVIKDTPPHISEIKQTLPRHLGRIVNHCLEKNPDRRFQSAKDIRNDLEGLKKEIDSGDPTLTSAPSYVAPAQKSRSWIPWVIVGLVVIAALITLWVSMSPDQGEQAGVAVTTDVSQDERPTRVTPTKTDDRTMTVVLPFRNLGPPEDAYFAAGVTEEITSRLAAVGDLGVISRTTATQYDRAGKTVKDIGEDLGVDYVLEGAVRWAKNPDGSGRVRITPQLVRVADDRSVWSQTYDRDMTDIFEVQSDIASSVIEQMGVTLLGSERELVADAPTDNMEAYQVYLQAKDIQPGADFEAWDTEFVTLMTKATELDPKFVDAWSELSRHHSVYYNGQFDKTEERLNLAREALRRAEELEPDHFRTHLARGAYYYYGFRDYDQALVHFLAAMEIMPNEAEVREMVGYIYRRQAKWTEAIDNMKAAFDLNPRDANIAVNIAGTYEALREFEMADRYYQRAIDVRPDDQYRWSRAGMVIRWKGDLETAGKMLPSDPENPWYDFAGAFYELQTRDYEAAREHVRRWDTSSPFIRAGAATFLARLDAHEYGPEVAREKLDEAIDLINELLKQAPGNETYRTWLAFCLAMRGDHDTAVSEAKLVADLLAKDRFAGPGGLQVLAEVYGIVGRHEEAIDILERLLNTVYESPITPEILLVDPAYDPLRENPRFKELLPKENI